tara:strand:+ start:332 stop:454 length:123 start_codon:yes stop_codon:yes gene_type:complete
VSLSRHPQKRLYFALCGAGREIRVEGRVAVEGYAEGHREA